MQRIKFLDGLRGIAISLVILVHAYADYGWVRQKMYPFGDYFFEHVPFVRFFFLGVQLFFLISGFVILMTLENSKSFKEFALKRWLRLFPAMLVCSLLVYFTIPLFPLRPYPAPTLGELIPGLLFVEPSWVGKLTHTNQLVLEGSFWTLFVEVKFYVMFGLMYFFAGWRTAIAMLVALGLLAAGVDFLSSYHLNLPFNIAPIEAIVHFLSAQHLMWFASGALFYKYFQNKQREMLFLALLVGLIASRISFHGYMREWAFAFCVVLLFASALVSLRVQKILSSRIIVFMGFISYPLYLLHEGMMISMIRSIGKLAPNLPAFLIPLLPITLVVLAAWFIATCLEPKTKNMIKLMLKINHAKTHVSA